MRFRDPAASVKQALALALTLTLGGLAGCSDHESSRSFPPADYSYLPQFHLNVANIAVQNRAVPPADALNARAPIPPEQALTNMEAQRLIATGSSGEGQFIINQAYIVPAGENGIAGALDVQLNVADAGNRHTGFIHARVTRKLDAGSGDPSSPEVLYDFTNQMMQDMNVELEFQIHKKLENWLTDAAGNPLVNGGVQAQPLGAPGSEPLPPVTPTAAPASAAPAAATPVSAAPKVKAAVPAAPDAIFPTGDGDAQGQDTTPKEKSPPAGVLRLPDSASPGADQGDTPQ